MADRRTRERRSPATAVDASPRSMKRHRARPLASWLALVAVVIATLGIGVTDRRPRSDDERAQAIAKSIRCPTCRGQSVAVSEAPIAAFLRREITRRINGGNPTPRFKPRWWRGMAVGPC